MEETMERWEERTSDCIRKNKTDIAPKIEHIRDIEWEKPEVETTDATTLVRKKKYPPMYYKANLK